MDLVEVTTATDAGLANTIKDVLAQAGIECAIVGSGREDVFPTPSISPYAILVASTDAERARDLLAQYQNEPEDDEGD